MPVQKGLPCNCRVRACRTEAILPLPDVGRALETWYPTTNRAAKAPNSDDASAVRMMLPDDGVRAVPSKSIEKSSGVTKNITFVKCTQNSAPAPLRHSCRRIDRSGAVMSTVITVLSRRLTKAASINDES